MGTSYFIYNEQLRVVLCCHKTRWLPMGDVTVEDLFAACGEAVRDDDIESWDMVGVWMYIHRVDAATVTFDGTEGPTPWLDDAFELSPGWRGWELWGSGSARWSPWPASDSADPPPKRRPSNVLPVFDVRGTWRTT